MKKTLLIVASLLMLIAFTPNAKAQEWSTSLDIYSSYIWRGTKFGSGPAFQPGVELGAGGLAVGAWGSVSSSTDEALEMDLYLGYSFDFGLSFTLTDYYFGGDWTEYSSNHYLEPSVGIEAGGFSAMAAFMFMPEVEASSGVAGSPAMVDLQTGVYTPAVEAMDPVEGADFGEEIDVYFEAAYSFENVSLTLGAGDGAYTDDGKFNLCNITLGTSKEVSLTESFTLPVSGAVTLNPSTGGFCIAVGISL